MRNFSMIVWVAIVSLVGCAIMALAIYLVDSKADRHDKRG
jgi:hypothetical protein